MPPPTEVPKRLLRLISISEKLFVCYPGLVALFQNAVQGTPKSVYICILLYYHYETECGFVFKYKAKNWMRKEETILTNISNFIELGGYKLLLPGNVLNGKSQNKKARTIFL